MIIREIQSQVAGWYARWPTSDGSPALSALTLADKAGGACRAVVNLTRARESSREEQTTEESRRDVAHALADLFIATCGVAESYGIDLELAVTGRWLTSQGDKPVRTARVNPT